MRAQNQRPASGKLEAASLGFVRARFLRSSRFCQVVCGFHKVPCRDSPHERPTFCPPLRIFLKYLPQPACPKNVVRPLAANATFFSDLRRKCGMKAPPGRLVDRVRAQQPNTNDAVKAERLEVLLKRHAAALQLYARQFCQCGDDVVQDAIIELAACQPAPRDDVAWLYGTVRRKAISAARRARRRKRREPHTAAPPRVC